jgi:hypothetical protein
VDVRPEIRIGVSKYVSRFAWHFHLTGHGYGFGGGGPALAAVDRIGFPLVVVPNPVVITLVDA